VHPTQILLIKQTIKKMISTKQSFTALKVFQTIKNLSVDSLLAKDVEVEIFKMYSAGEFDVGWIVINVEHNGRNFRVYKYSTHYANPKIINQLVKENYIEW
jgi:hypothetical protein